MLGELNCVSCHALPAKAEAAVEVVKSPLLGETPAAARIRRGCSNGLPSLTT